MAIKREAFIDKYLEELSDNVKLIDSAIITLKRDPENEDELSNILRALHTIKGSSRMLKFEVVEQVAHGMESVFKGVREKRYEVTNNLTQLIFVGTDYLRAAAKGIRATQSDELPVEGLLKACEKAYANEPYVVNNLKLSGNISEVVEENLPMPPVESGDEVKVSAPPQQSSQVKAESLAAGYESIRIKIKTIDRLIKLVNELIIKQFQFKKDSELISELEERFEELWTFASRSKDWKSDSNELSRREKDFSKNLQQMKKNFIEKTTIIERVTFELQEQIIGLRMLPLEMIMGGLERMVEETAMALGKEVEFSIRGMDVMMDKAILEKINDPIIHLVRNSVDHGIESPEERERRGKARAGRIEVDCYNESGSIIIKLKDDGKGIDYSQVKKKAIGMNPAAEDEIEQMSHEELNNFIFMSGFSTRSKVSELSGRGVGLDIVRYNIEKVKGKIALHSVHGQGTEFTLTLPLSLATVEGFFIVSAGKKFLVPSNFVKEIIILQEEERLKLLDKKVFRLRDKIIPLYKLSQILNLPGGYRESENSFVIVSESIGETIGITVDSIIEYSSLIFKPLPRSLQRLRYIQGIVFDESFDIICILHIPGLIEKFKSVRSIDSRKRFVREEKRNKTILVVDDSSNTREIEKSILELENYQVITAVDGIDGLEKLKQRRFDLIISDINMPRMDGYTFVENVRNEEDHKDTPFILVSSMDNEEDREKGFALGANGYIVKSNFDRNNLIDEVKRFIG